MAGQSEGCSVCGSKRWTCPVDYFFREYFPLKRFDEWRQLVRVFGGAGTVKRMIRSAPNDVDRDELVSSLYWEAAAWGIDWFAGPYGLYKNQERELKRQLALMQPSLMASEGNNVPNQGFLGLSNGSMSMPHVQMVDERPVATSYQRTGMGGNSVASKSEGCSCCFLQRRTCPEDCFLRKYFPASQFEESRQVAKVFGGPARLRWMIHTAPNDIVRDEFVASLYWEASAWATDSVRGPYGLYNYQERELIQLASMQPSLVTSEGNNVPNQGFLGLSNGSTSTSHVQMADERSTATSFNHMVNEDRGTGQERNNVVRCYGDPIYYDFMKIEEEKTCNASTSNEQMVSKNDENLGEWLELGNYKQVRNQNWGKFLTLGNHEDLRSIQDGQVNEPQKCENEQLGDSQQEKGSSGPSSGLSHVSC